MVTGTSGTTGTTELLRAIVGDAHVRAAEEADAVRGVTPAFVVEPADSDEIAKVLRAADDGGLAVIPRGGGTKLDWGNPPRRADVVVSTARLSGIVEHAWADLTVTVQAGCTIEALQARLAEHGQRLAADPLWPARATIGGALATNDTGALRLRFGGWRDLVIGTTVALADGTLARSGGKVVKNVAGYDLSKLMTGAVGTLGVVTTAVFRLHPLPRAARTLSAAVADFAHAQRVIAALQDSTLVYAAAAVRAADGQATAVDVLIEGTAAGVDAQTAALRALVEDARLEESPAAVWQARDVLWTEPGGGPIVKISGLVTELAATLDLVRRVAAAANVRWRALCHGTGLAWARFLDTPPDWPAVVGTLRSATAAYGGSVTILRPAPSGPPCDTWDDVGGARTLMAAVKRQFDPRDTLNPGRFVSSL